MLREPWRGGREHGPARWVGRRARPRPPAWAPVDPPLTRSPEGRGRAFLVESRVPPRCARVARRVHLPPLALDAARARFPLGPGQGPFHSPSGRPRRALADPAASIAPRALRALRVRAPR